MRKCVSDQAILRFLWVFSIWGLWGLGDFGDWGLWGSSAVTTLVTWTTKWPMVAPNSSLPTERSKNASKRQ